MAPDGICGGTLCFPDSRGQVAWNWVHALTSILWLTCRAQGSALSDTARSVVTVVCWGTGNSFFVITYKSRNAPTLCLKLEAATEHMYFSQSLHEFPDQNQIAMRFQLDLAGHAPMWRQSVCLPCLGLPPGLSFLTQTSHGTERSQTKMNKCCAVKVFKAKHGWETAGVPNVNECYETAFCFMFQS